MYGTNLNLPEYQGIINTVFAACEAARLGDLKTIQRLHSDGVVDFNLGDYDSNSPLIYAVKTKRVDIVKYLVDTVEVVLNKVDRWGGTAIDYALNGTEIHTYL